MLCVCVYDLCAYVYRKNIYSWAHHWVNGLMGWVGASYGSVSKQTRVSKPDSRIENRRAKLQKCRDGGMTTYPYIYIYICVCIYIYIDALIFFVFQLLAC